ncbi:MAG: hypothetical protein R2712_09320 [Vicinamibacterales bacterium]
MSDNGSGYVSGAIRAVCASAACAISAPGLPPRTNRKAERFIQTLLQERAYGGPTRTPRPAAGTATAGALLQPPTAARESQLSPTHHPLEECCVMNDVLELNLGPGAQCCYEIVYWLRWLCRYSFSLDPAEAQNCDPIVSRIYNIESLSSSDERDAVLLKEVESLDMESIEESTVVRLEIEAWGYGKGGGQFGLTRREMICAKILLKD